MSVGSGFFARTAPSLAGLLALAVFAGLWMGGAQTVYTHLLLVWGMIPFQYPFLDLDGALAAWDCSRTGVDVILADPCDVLQRGYNYPPFWMTIDWIPLGRPDRIGVGLALSAAFLLSLSALPRPLSRTETMLRIAAVLSTMIVFAIERANPDLLIFLLVILMLSLLRRSLIARTAGYGIAFLGGAIKYYPFILLSLMARERVRVLIPVILAAVMGLGLFFYHYLAQIREGLPHIASGGPFGDMFGARNFPMGVFLIVRHLLDSSADDKLRAIDSTAIVIGIAALIATALLVAVVVRTAITVWRASDIPGAVARLDEPRRYALLAGALLLAGCFIAGQSIGYRGVFFLLILPGLYALGQDEAAGRAAVAARWAAIGVVPLMWAEAIRLWIYTAIAGHLPPLHGRYVMVLEQPVGAIVWGVREIAWWLLVALLSLILLGFFVDSPAFRFLGPHLSIRRTS
ncbi:MAG: hypothetical protein EPO08_06745 [Rhodospirillaceae bacterium]|nr:MAG: hypothetical protein EPO08_06745 [Rhodospirillaceae bacterium]